MCFASLTLFYEYTLCKHGAECASPMVEVDVVTVYTKLKFRKGRQPAMLEA